VAGRLGKEIERTALLKTAKQDAERMGAHRLLDLMASLSTDAKKAATGG
jgi:hypothetical protein